MTTLNFDGVAISRAVCGKPGTSPVQGLEPKFVAVDADGTQVWVPSAGEFLTG